MIQGFCGHNGLLSLTFLERIKISKANKLYHLTAKLVRWAVQEGCLFCVENPQFSLFWQTTFIQDIMRLMQFTTFQSCQNGSTRPMRTMLGFNAVEFETINKMCPGVTDSHKHDAWGTVAGDQKFATSLETAYPMKLARMIAMQFVAAFQRLGIKVPPETMSEISAGDSAILPIPRAQTGVQPCASRLPPLIPTYGARVALTGLRSDLPQVEVNCKLHCNTHVAAVNAPTELPKGSKLLQLLPAMLPQTCLQRGALVSGQHLTQDDVDKFTAKFGVAVADRGGTSGTQVWGIPWSEDEFLEQMVKFRNRVSSLSCVGLSKSISS